MIFKGIFSLLLIIKFHWLIKLLLVISQPLMPYSFVFDWYFCTIFLSFFLHFSFYHYWNGISKIWEKPWCTFWISVKWTFFLLILKHFSAGLNCTSPPKIQTISVNDWRFAYNSLSEKVVTSFNLWINHFFLMILLHQYIEKILW